MKKISAIYIRVSTDAQREEGYSIEAQKEMLTAYCVSKGIKNYDYYIDGGYSGSNIHARNADLRNGVLDLARSHKLVYKRKCVCYGDRKAYAVNCRTHKL